MARARMGRILKVALDVIGGNRIFEHVELPLGITNAELDEISKVLKDKIIELKAKQASQIERGQNRPASDRDTL